MIKKINLYYNEEYILKIIIKYNFKISLSYNTLQSNLMRWENNFCAIAG